MTDEINTGGPAFPVIAENGLGHIADGMTLRDYFAAHAPEMPDPWFRDSHREWPQKHWAEIDAEWRLFHADAMLAARAR